MARVKVFKLPFETTSAQLLECYQHYGVAQAKIAYHTFNGQTKSRGWAILDFPSEEKKQEAQRDVTRVGGRYVSYAEVTEHDMQMLKGKIKKQQKQQQSIRLPEIEFLDEEDDEEAFSGSYSNPPSNTNRSSVNMPPANINPTPNYSTQANLFGIPNANPAAINKFGQQNPALMPAPQIPLAPVPNQNISSKASLKLDSIPETYFASHKFFVIDFETSLPTDHIHLPVELGIYAFSFKDGKVKTFHKFIDSGIVPSYYIGSALWKEENVHGIPHSRFSQAEKNYSELWKEICLFVDLPEQKSAPVNFFAKSPASKTACLEWIANKAGSQNHFGDVRPVEELIESACKRRYKDRGFNTAIRTRMQEIFSRLEKIQEGKCEYHKSKDSKSGRRY